MNPGIDVFTKLNPIFWNNPQSARLPKMTLKTVFQMPKEKISLAQLASFLCKSADILRDKMDASKFKEFIFGMLFFDQ